MSHLKILSLVGQGLHCIWGILGHKHSLWDIRTGYYCCQLVYYLLESDIKALIDNLLSVKGSTQMRLTKNKTDKCDSNLNISTPIYEEYNLNVVLRMTCFCLMERRVTYSESFVNKLYIGLGLLELLLSLFFSPTI